MRKRLNDSGIASEGTIIAAVDLGSNSFHMIVAEESGTQLQVRDRLRETVRLADGLDRKGDLDTPSRQRALACLRRFGQRLSGFPRSSVRAVGTNTLRKAKDPSFLREAEQALGFPIEVIAGVEEARLIYLGVAHGLPDSEHNRLVVDIGGGSTELILGRRFEPLELESMYMGCVSHSRRYFPDGVITTKAMREAVIAARLELQALEADYRAIGWGQAIGASGTVKAVAGVIRAMGWAEEGITYAALQCLVTDMVKAGHIDRLQLKGLKGERLPVFPGGVAVLMAIFEGLSIDTMHVSGWALREGLLFDLLGRRHHEDVRECTVMELSRRYRIDTGQAARVEATAKIILEQLTERWELLGEEYELLLRWAARLHEMGLAIAHSGYHKHGDYLVANSDMPGFSRSEQRRLAVLIRGHRRKFPLARFNEFEAVEKMRLQRLCIILRLAVLLHRSHAPSGAPDVMVKAEASSLKLCFPDGWLKAHPLTEADLVQESAYLNAAGYELEFS
ncbi:MAG: exopolyphosphatase [Pseudomonadota bacterium]